MDQQPRGRGAALLKKLQDLQVKDEASLAQPAASLPSPTSSIVSSGRGRGYRLAQQLEAAQAAFETQPIPVARGRAALTQKLLELNKLSQVAIQTTPPIPQVAPPAEKPQPYKEAESESSELSQPVKYEGTEGSKVPSTANYLRLTVEPLKGVFEYDLFFQPEIDNKNIRIKILNSQLSKLGGVKAYDGGRCLYLPIRLPDPVTQLETTHPISGDKSTMNVVYKKQKRLGDCIHLFNTLLRRIMRVLAFFQFNRNFFDIKHAIMIPQHRLEVMPGYIVNAEEYEGGLMLCLDAHHKVLRSQTVLDLLLELRMTLKDRMERLRQEACNIVIGSQVLTRYNNKNYRIDDILWDASPEDTFDTDSGQKISYVTYYKTQHGLTIKDTKQPLLLHKKSVKVSGQSQKEDRFICLIPELCYMTGLTDQMRNDYTVMKSVAEYTRLSPAQRMKSLTNFVNNVKKSPEASKVLSDWGLTIEDGTIDLHVRILRPEMIYFGGSGKYQSDHKADWGMACAKNQMIGPVDLLEWVIVFVQKDQMSVKEFVETMVRLGDAMGCTIRRPQLHQLQNDRTATYVDACNRVISPNTQCVVFVTPTARADLYTSVKKLCCLKTPVASQVILSRTLNNKKRFRNIVQKIAMQINCKLGGALWSLHIPVKSWMVCGIDIYHSKGNQPSVCGFVASLNQTFSRWYSMTMQQEKEIADCLKVAFVSCLEKRREVEGVYPTNVIIFRDGVGDGQLKHCLDYEVEQFLNCIRSLNLDIKITMVIVQKRINTRIFLNRSGSLEENPPPGTILDHTVTRYNYQDFFLVSQHVTQGTVTPTHYVVLYDNAGLKVDHVQKLTYKMCHLYYNWAGTIRVPAPCQYAHKLAYFVGQYLGKAPPDSLYSRLYYL